MKDIFIILAIPFAISFLLSLYITQRMRIISYNGSVYLSNHALSTIIASATIGVTLPFSACKRFSKKWEKTLIGSSGNYILGYILSYLTIGMIRQSGSYLPEEAIIVCIGISFVPVMDAIRVLKTVSWRIVTFLRPTRTRCSICSSAQECRRSLCP